MVSEYSEVNELIARILSSLQSILGKKLVGLYLCGSGAHPGGGVTGAPGANAAREILGDLKRRS